MVLVIMGVSLSLSIVEIVVFFYFTSSMRVKILYKHRMKNINIGNLIKSTIIFCLIISTSLIFISTHFEWYYIFLPILVMCFLLIHSVCYIPKNKGDFDYEYYQIPDEDVKTYEREIKINNILNK